MSTEANKPGRDRSCGPSRTRLSTAGRLGLAALGLLATTVLAVARPAGVAFAAADPVLVAAGDIACEPANVNYNSGNGQNNACQMKATANEIASISPQYLLPLGDTQYNDSASQGTQPALTDYQASYDSTWGALASTAGGPIANQNIHPIPGNHEYGDVNDTDAPLLANASTYFSNFGPSGLNELPSGVNSPSNDWYSFNIPVNGGTWHVISLDSECTAVGGCGSGSPEETFLKNDLAANAGVCTIVNIHEPRWSVGPLGNEGAYATFWGDAVAAHVAMVLNGHDHDYEHFGPMDANGNPVTNGTSEFIVGTGGGNLDAQSGTSPALLASDFNDFGVLKLTLHSTGADYAFQTVGGAIKDSGTVGCSVSTPSVTALSPNSGPSAGGTSVTVTGTNLSGATAVKFGTLAATSFSVNSATQITATAPAGSGTVDVTVTTSGGTSTTSSADRFTYTVSTKATITALGTLANKSGTAVTTLAVSPQHVGDLLILAVKTSSTTITAASVSGGGVSTWTRAEGPYSGYSGHDLEIWTGTVGTIGSSTITVAYSGAVTSINIGLAAQEFTSTSGSATVWALDTGGATANASSTTATFPQLTPAGTGELYFGYGAVANTGLAGATSGFTYATTSDADVATYDTSVASVVQPTATQSPAGVAGAVAVLITAS